MFAKKLGGGSIVDKLHCYTSRCSNYNLNCRHITCSLNQVIISN